MKITKYNYLIPIRLFIHYLMRSGLPVWVDVEKPDGELPKWSAQYLALGHFNYDSRADLYDFNPGEGWGLLKYIGKPFYIYW